MHMQTTRHGGLGRGALLLAAALCLTAPASAEHWEIESGLPTEVEDAYPTAYRNRELQAFIRYERQDDGSDRGQVVPRLEFGIFPNTELSIEGDFLFGNADRTGCGDVTVEGLYNFNTETLTLPAFSISAALTPPTGRDSAGLDTSLGLLVTKTLGRSSLLHQVHFNGYWLHNSSPRDDERDDMYKLVLGYSRRVGTDTMLVMDILREQERQEDEAINLAEVGLRYSITPNIVLSGGVGFGFGDESPDVRVTFGFQYSF